MNRKRTQKEIKENRKMEGGEVSQCGVVWCNIWKIEKKKYIEMQ